MSAGGDRPSITGSRPARGLAMAALLLFLGVLVVYLDRPGYTPLRLALFAVLGGVAVLGTAGAVTGRAWLAAVGAGLLALLGLPQAVLWVFVLPMAGVLAAASLLIALDDRTVEER
ncbi:hypothetical protein B4589_011260 [Halolamina sp. CBA1230]|uniref:hypothetical protein n=1 Tax=Halolamina sp. CBA1230 TaxID=1853690 RepID=UPI0009A1C70C|nr:hypothetical protein [Halolamina sp. CBA1230]QKY20922.1 hypothetical protein B4589_011260 [Halolamina sp. CBA1230]